MCHFGAWVHRDDLLGSGEQVPGLSLRLVDGTCIVGAVGVGVAACMFRVRRGVTGVGVAGVVMAVVGVAMTGGSVAGVGEARGGVSVAGCGVAGDGEAGTSAEGDL